MLARCIRAVLRSTVFVLLNTASACFALAQAPPVFTHATSANNWMTATVSPWRHFQSSLSPSIKKARDIYFDKLIGKELPLTPESARASHLSEGAFIGIPPDVPGVENRQVLIGTFVSYEPVLSESKRSIYTEVVFRPEVVLERAGVANLSNTAAVTVIVPGGTVVNPDGSVLSFMTNPRHEFIAPGKRYLLVLSYHSDGDFNMLVRAWDISDGTAKPGYNTLHSPLLGLVTDRILPVVRSRIGLRP